MRLSVISWGALVVLPLAAANYDLYRVEFTGPKSTSVAWQVFEAEAESCDVAMNAPIWADSNDVGGYRLGVRCKGSGCSASAPITDIEELEMHFGSEPSYHWTMYKDRNRDMIGQDGEKYGDCIPFPNGDYDCPEHIPPVLGKRKFRCLTKFTVEELGANWKRSLQPTLREFIQSELEAQGN